MKFELMAVVAAAVGLVVAGCKEQAEGVGSHAPGTHTHADGTVHADHAEDAAEKDEHDHDHAPLGKVAVGDIGVEVWQGHGAVEAGKECHLTVKLPVDDAGATMVRAWIGTEDRTLSMVGKGTYSAEHGDYDLHAVAPDPLPEGAMWWIEIEKPDGTRAVGSVPAKMD